MVTMSAANPMPRRRADAEEPIEKTVSITIRFPISLRKRAIAVATAEYRTFASLVLQAVDNYVAEKERTPEERQMTETRSKRPNGEGTGSNI